VSHLPLALLVVVCLQCRAAHAIMNGVNASGFPEGVLIQPLGCSGVLVGPREVWTAGHCYNSEHRWEVIAPLIGRQRRTVTRYWTTWAHDYHNSLDLLKLFLDQDLVLSSYPERIKTDVAPNTPVVMIGRTLNDKVTDNLWQTNVSVLITGSAKTKFGFPFNLMALPDVTESGDSGGPVFWLKPAEEPNADPIHVLVGLTDTDTLELMIPSNPPVDLPVRVDTV